MEGGSGSGRPGAAREIRIEVLGPFRVFRDGAVLPAQAVASRKGRTLLKLLLARRGGVVPAETLAEALWGSSPPADPEANLATLVSRLRTLLGTEAIAGDRQGWRFSGGGRIRVDLDEAERLVGEAEARLGGDEPALARTASERALALLGRGAVLADEPEAEWAEEARREGQRLATRARRAAWRAALELGDSAAALEHARAAVAAEPLDEASHRALMLAHHHAGEPGAALAAYERLRTMLADELGADPGPRTEALHLAILRGEGAALEPAAGGEGAPGGPLAQSPLVGRDAELGELTRAWSAAVAQQPGMVLVTGEGGIGKTRLAQELAALARATGGLVAQARCYQAERSLFLQPLVEAVRGVLVALPPERVAAAAGPAAGTLAELIPELRDLLELPSYQRAPAELQRRRSFEAVTALLAGLARQQPVLLSLDDLHQAGAATLELLHFLLRRLTRGRLLVAATVRGEEAGEVTEALGHLDRVRTVELGPLSQEAIAELARRLGVAGLAERVGALTHGHTLFALEALRAAREGGGLERNRIPPSLEEAVLARVRRAGPEVEALLRAAVVVGAAFDLEVVTELLELPLEEVAGRAERALASRLLVESGDAYELANDLYREVLYETTPRPTRVARHRRLATLLAGRPEAVAGHAAAAGDWHRSAAAWLEAAAQATATYANRDAERLLGSALEAAGSAGDPLLEARARLERGRVREALGEYRGALDDHGRALELARSAGDERLEAAALERLGWTTYYARNSGSDLGVAGVADLAERAERAARAAAARPSALVLAGRIRHSEGDLDAAREAFVAALGGEPDVTTEALARHSLALLLEHSDRFAEAARLFDRSADESARAGVFRAVLTSRFGAALAFANQGDYGRALERLAALERWLAEVDDPLYHARAATTRSWLWRELGQPDRALQAAERAVSLAAGAPTSHAGLHARLGLAECLLLAGDQGETERALAAMATDDPRNLPYGWRLELRQLELSSQLRPELAERLLQRARAAGSAKYQALALARLGRRDQATRLARQVGSDALLAEVAEPAEARAALQRIAARLPAELRQPFTERGRLASLRQAG
jgi:DNA-binding SARP family transcriptional activator